MNGVFRIFFSRYASKQVGIIGCLALAALVEGLGLATLLPVLNTISGGGDTAAGMRVNGLFDSLGLPASHLVNTTLFEYAPEIVDSTTL